MDILHRFYCNSFVKFYDKKNCEPGHDHFIFKFYIQISAITRCDKGLHCILSLKLFFSGGFTSQSTIFHLLQSASRVESVLSLIGPSTQRRQYLNYFFEQLGMLPTPFSFIWGFGHCKC